MKFLCLTHSSRKFFAADSSFNSLELRFSDKSRLDDLPPLESFASVDQAVPYDGALSVWQVNDAADRPSLVYLFRYDPGYKVQSAAFHEDRLIVFGSDRLEVLNLDLKPVRTIRHPLLVGGHTVFVDEQGHALVTGAPANSVFRFDLHSGVLVERISIPDCYGIGHSLDGADLHAHYIPTDCQPTHVNCAFPTNGDILVTLLIPGAVGAFNKNRDYREIVTGLRGCHGAKRFGDLLYLSDSSAGTVLYLDPQTGAVRKRLHADSRWLHDADHINTDTIALALGDRNELRLVGVRSGDVLQSELCDSFGESVMFVSSFEVSPSWSDKYVPEPRKKKKSRASDAANYGPELLPPIMNYRGWSMPDASVARIGSMVESSGHTEHAYLLVGREVRVRRGRYRFQAEIRCQTGSLMLGLLDVEKDNWLAQVVMDRENRTAVFDIAIKKASTVKPILSAVDQKSGTRVLAEVRELSLRKTAKQKESRNESALKKGLPARSAKRGLG